MHATLPNPGSLTTSSTRAPPRRRRGKREFSRIGKSALIFQDASSALHASNPGSLTTSSTSAPPPRRRRGKREFSRLGKSARLHACHAPNPGSLTTSSTTTRRGKREFSRLGKSAPLQPSTLPNPGSLTTSSTGARRGKREFSPAWEKRVFSLRPPLHARDRTRAASPARLAAVTRSSWGGEKMRAVRLPAPNPRVLPPSQTASPAGHCPGGGKPAGEPLPDSLPAGKHIQAAFNHCRRVVIESLPGQNGCRFEEGQTHPASKHRRRVVIESLEARQGFRFGVPKTRS